MRDHSKHVNLHFNRFRSETKHSTKHTNLFSYSCTASYAEGEGEERWLWVKRFGSIHRTYSSRYSISENGSEPHRNEDTDTLTIIIHCTISQYLIRRNKISVSAFSHSLPFVHSVFRCILMQFSFQFFIFSVHRFYSIFLRCTIIVANFIVILSTKRFSLLSDVRCCAKHTYAHMEKGNFIYILSRNVFFLSFLRRHSFCMYH